MINHGLPHKVHLAKSQQEDQQHRALRSETASSYSLFAPFYHRVSHRAALSSSSPTFRFHAVPVNLGLFEIVS